MKYSAVIAIPGRSPIQVITTPNAAYPYFHAIEIHVYTTLHSGEWARLSPSNKPKLGPYSRVKVKTKGSMHTYMPWAIHWWDYQTWDSYSFLKQFLQSHTPRPCTYFAQKNLENTLPCVNVPLCIKKMCVPMMVIWQKTFLPVSNSPTKFRLNRSGHSQVVAHFQIV